MKVAIVGAGISGVAAGAHLKVAGIEITVFERSAEAGGVWRYDERLPPEPAYPAIIPSEGDSVYYDDRTRTQASHDSSHGADTDQDIKHAPPGPCYEGLSNNVSTRLMKLKINSWPDGTPDFVNHRILNSYIQDTSRKAGVDANTRYGTRVEEVSKQGSVWKVRTSRFSGNSAVGKRSEQDWVCIEIVQSDTDVLTIMQDFDAVLISSGHYHACRVPDIPGLAECKERWPDRVQHSKSYRNPTGFRDQNVLLIGAGVSSTDIARELGPEARKIYQLSRGGTFDLPSSFLPFNATRIRGELDRLFIPPDASVGPLADHLHPLPLRACLKDGRELIEIHRIVLCTGYHITLPFLRQYHSDETPVRQASEEVLVTDGTQVHNLHKDIFYIPDPTLVFVGIPFFTATFSLFEFQAITVAAVLSGKAFLPTRDEMRREYRERVEKKGVGKLFHTLKDKEVEYVDELVGWLNKDGAAVGAELVEGHTPAWHVANLDRIEKVRRIMEDKQKDANSFH